MSKIVKTSGNAQNSANVGKLGQQEKLVEKHGLQSQQPRTHYQMETTGQIAEAQNKQGIYLINIVIIFKLNL